MEVWKDIPNYEGIYQVSNLGKVKSLLFRNGKYTFPREKEIKICFKRGNTENAQPRPIVSLQKNRIRKNYYVHKLVALAFIENPNGLPEINHIDGNALNNNSTNLEWCDRKYNSKHAYDNNLMKNFKSMNEKNKKRVLRSDGKIYNSAFEASIDNGVVYGAIKNNVNKKSKTCVGYTFQYID